MSRILVGCLPAAGHLRPALPIVTDLVAQGHDVLFYTGAAYRAQVERTGATYAPIVHGIDADESADMAEIFPERAKLKPGLATLVWDMENIFVGGIPAYVQDLEALVEEFRPDVLVGDFGSLALTVLAERDSLPLAMFGITALTTSSIDTAPFGFGLAPSSSALGRLRNRALNALMRDQVMGKAQRAFNRIRASYGLEPVSHSFLDHPAHASDVYLQSTVAGFEYPRSDLPASVRFVGAAKLRGVDDWTPPSWWADLTPDRRVVLVTQGTVATDPDEVIRPAVKALAGEDVLVIAATGIDPEVALPVADRPANVRAEAFIPFDRLLPLVDLMITNGGYGGVSQALAAGVPLVVAGKSEDKVEVSARVAWSGAGINLKTQRPTPEAILRATDRVLSDGSYRRAATRLAAEFAAHDSAAEQVEAILELVAKPAPAASVGVR